ncbi:uncharacterized protein LOC132875026 [Neoarius graeffei]|uniref:uncharacterized protein LOC132875026 n=1 Tax=Neoarius graeffei TaxID=443677 RepID=UPI00298C99D7|nr:uncharacterized protein LOC132875026 [Neoarius graeffei]
MAQNCITEYLKADSKQEKIVLRFCLEMVTETQLSADQNLELESFDTEGECVVDGILPQKIRGSYEKADECKVLIQNRRQKLLRPENIKPRRQTACMNNSTSDITIYSYKSNVLDDLEKGVPVVLKISDSNQFLKCTFIGNKASLAVEYWEQDQLDLIYKNDPATWPFVFYLSTTKDNCRRFESAECNGWFIRTESDSVYMDEHREKDSDNYYFYVIRLCNTTKSK